MKTLLFSASVVSILAIAFGSGCASTHTTTASSSSGSDTVDQGSEANDAAGSAASLGSTLIGGDSTSLRLATARELTRVPGQLQLDDVGSGAKGFYRPAGCLVVSADLNARTAKYSFNDCTGPWGLVHVTGEVDVNWQSSAANQLTVNSSTTGLKVNRATLDWSATASVTANGLARDMTWSGTFNGTTARGHAFRRTDKVEYKWTVGQACLSVAGTCDGTIVGKEVRWDVINFSMCEGGCPQAGSEIKITDVTAQKVYDVRWNAGDATYTDPYGTSTTFTPWCAL